MSDWIQRLIADGGYFGLFLLMLAETVFPPLPSEVIMSMAGLQAAKGVLSLPGAILSGSAGAMVGNLLWYLLARWLGMGRFRPLIERHGRWLTLDWAEVQRAERWFSRHGYLVVFVGRMTPTLRSLISVPAGLLRMPILPFIAWSALGTIGWSAILAFGGWLLGTRFSEMEVWLDSAATVALALMAGVYLWRLVRWRRPR